MSSSLIATRRGLGAVLFSCLTFSSVALAQPNRIQKPIGASGVVALRGGRTDTVRQSDDRGPVNQGQRIAGMRLKLKPSPSQAAALEQLLAEQQDPASPNYHNWLTPEEYADRFGASPEDVAAMESWLESQGFHIDYSARGRDSIGFSGMAGDVQKTFRTELRRYLVEGEMHYANASDPWLPAELEPLVRTIRGLDDFDTIARSRTPRPRITQYIDGSHYLAPDDIATIYNIKPLYKAGFNGAGQTVAIVGMSAVRVTDIQDFRRIFSLAAGSLQMRTVPYYPDPGINQGSQVEATMDVELVAAVAPGAAVVLVYSTDPIAAMEYTIDQNIAPIISTSLGKCEAKASSQFSLTDLEAEAQKANLMGVTWVASSGDAGAAGCDPHGQGQQYAQAGPGVMIPSSLPEVTAVGGTQFNEGTGNYWNFLNDPATQGSALSYIPETAWNSTLQDIYLNGAGGGLSATGGGVSTFYQKPAWQTGPGVPNDGWRDVPDVAFAASWDHDPYCVCINGDCAAGQQAVPTTNGGTSAATPVFAGMVALLNQYLVTNHVQSKPGLANINPTLYRMAQTTTGVFHDITTGNNSVQCLPGTASCPASGQFGYPAGPGYDQATGLGSLDVNAFVTKWSGGGSTPAATGTTTTVTAGPSSISASASTSITATVKAASGTTSPSGTVSFLVGKSSLGTAALTGSGGSATATLKVYGSQLAAGSNSITASYGGNTNFAASSGSVSVAVTIPVTTSAVTPSVTPNPVYQQPADADGFGWFYTVRLSEIAGVATTLTGFSIDGTDHTGDMVAWFGSTTLPAHGSLSASVRSKVASVPATRVFEFEGKDAGGQTWTEEVTVRFYGQQISAAMTLSSSPDTEVQNPNGDSHCSADHPYYQQLNLQENNGYGVVLTRFLAGSSDLSDEIGARFGSLHLAPLGTLQASMCWKVASAPSTLNYEIDGLDAAGNTITAKLQVPFQGAAASAGTLSTSKSSVALSVSPSQQATATLNVSVPTGQQWSVVVFPANQKSSWLVVSPVSGAGAAAISLKASASGLVSGVYTATLVFEAVNTSPQFVNVPVSFTVGASSSVSIDGVSNGASFQQTFAPGMILSVFGKNLANSTVLAPSVPLPLTLGGAVATVNGVPAPLYYVSPTQLNLQVPYETVPGNALLAVNNNGLVDSLSFVVKPAAPGIFVDQNGRITPMPTGRPGDTLVFYITGEGDVAPAVFTGTPPPAKAPVSQLPSPRLPLTMTVGGIAVTPAFVGIPYGLVGVTQINFVVPPKAAAGDQTVIVSVGGVASAPAKLQVTGTAPSSN